MHTPALEAFLPELIVVPARTFLMGSPVATLSDLARRYGGTRESYREESPQHEVELPAFLLARTPTTNALYAAYVAATGAAPPSHWRNGQPPEGRADHPVVNVRWEEAQAFCAWLQSVSGQPFRLPSEAEWEHAARGVDGRTFPWGAAYDPALANTREAGLGGTTPVGAYLDGAGPYGHLDLAGNVWEWTSTLDGLYPYRADDGREDAQRPGRRILRGGCYANPHGFARCACRFRLPPGVLNEFIGFRVAMAMI
jgi:formylglycine-generating enzyme required for sulfatase activity